MKTVENIAKEAIKARVIDVKITWVSNYRCPIAQIGQLNWTPMWSRADYVTNRRAENFMIENHDREFCYRYMYY